MTDSVPVVDTCPDALTTRSVLESVKNVTGPLAPDAIANVSVNVALPATLVVLDVGEA
jgi:hypothetical protein